MSCLCPNLINTRIFESERNRDDAVELRPNEAAAVAPLREAMEASGLPPSAAADRNPTEPYAEVMAGLEDAAGPADDS